ncbi:ABC transporter ATP-binding protein [Salipaludibacillus agaradhaerens]|uniref:ABC transporter ATP-binding protein n=1 Tax=Salipaludibacillus agaradhaerens TaxID=76935 RepID=A0A9Q4FYX8_SALAG|nr:ABC transporter ATP-binding protein [Salipaludibacillus agaradhaerens]MCR6098160.1 ABC transporter ATP-binding protein [Salipaludibacillus agaradhaerens]MCR6116210.1 ABC transporter ATP-binding protein [Salipaludibacillus agaradhaerens]
MLKVSHVTKSYKKGGMFSSKKQKVLHNVCFDCQAGECLGIIGESGSGKSTLGRLLLGVEKPDQGNITLNGQIVTNRHVRLGCMSAVFQNYQSSINPFFTVEDAIMEPLMMSKNKINTRHKVDQLLHDVGLSLSYKTTYPHELSGGEVQRVCIARAIATEPEWLILDEAISSLDMSIQLQILELLKGLKKTYKMSYIFITHDIQAAAYMCDRVLIFKEGQVEEIIAIDQLKYVTSPYAKRLLKALITF